MDIRGIEPLKLLYYSLPLVGIYVTIVILHYYSAHAYAWYCTPAGWYGFFVSPFIVTTPHCRALRWSIQQFSTNIESMWTILGTWIVTNVVNYTPIHF
jgi:hypothetical protein